MTPKNDKKISKSDSNQNTPHKANPIGIGSGVARDSVEDNNQANIKRDMLNMSNGAMDTHVARVVDALLKQNIDQRPKNAKKLVNAMSAALKFPLTSNDIELLLAELVARNLIAIIGNRVQYLF